MGHDQKNNIVKKKQVSGYRSNVVFHVSRNRVYDAITTLEGLSCWWTTLVKGSTKVGDEIRFEFEGLEEYIIMRVEKAEPPSLVEWTCVIHTSLPEWSGTKLRFNLIEQTPGVCELHFHHVGLTPDLSCYIGCKQGWDYFLMSLVSYVETGKGTPFGM